MSDLRVMWDENGGLKPSGCDCPSWTCKGCGKDLRWQITTVDEAEKWVATSVVMAPTGRSALDGVTKVDPPHWTSTLDPYVSL